MKNKGVVVVLTIIITLLCVYYLSFTFVSRGVQKEAVEFATDQGGNLSLSKKQSYLDSVWNIPTRSFLGKDYSYKEIKDTELNLGLDLQGGMHVTLEVSPIEILKGLSGDSQDPNFLAAIEKAKEMQKDSEASFSDLFYGAWQDISSNGQLAPIFISAANKDRFSVDSSNDEIMSVINEEIEDAIDRSFNILRTRIDRFGTSQPNIQRLQGTGRIQVEIPGADNPERVRKLLQGVAKLEFWEVAEFAEISASIQAINDVLVKENNANRALELSANSDSTSTVEGDAVQAGNLNELLSTEDETDSTAVDSLGNSLADQLEDSTNTNEIDSSFNAFDTPLMRGLQRGAGLGLAYDVRDTTEISRILRRKDIQNLIPRTIKYVWSVKPETPEGTDDEILYLYFVKTGRGQRAPLTGEVVTDARNILDPQTTKPAVSMQMNAKGAREWRKLTAKNIDRRIAIVLDNYVYSAPTVQNEIPNGSSTITGNFTLEEAKDLANILKAGTLPAPTRIVEEAVIGPTLGEKAQQQGIRSILAGLIIVVLFMIAYYAKGGFVANVALLFNIFFILGILAQLNAALTLPGAAGIVLTIGMSIDANVLIFERIREEMREGIALREAIKRGYDKAFSSIVDANVTTFLTAVILYTMGQGPVKGFAITLIIGIACSFFSAVYITRVIVDFLVRKGDESKLSFKTPLSKGLLSSVGINFMGKRRVAYIASVIFIALGVTVTLTNGLNLGVDFKGGRSYVVTFNEPVVASDIKVGLADSFDKSGVTAKNYNGNYAVEVTTTYLVDDESNEADSLVRTALIAGIKGTTGKDYVQDESRLDGEHFTISSSSKVGETIADDIKSASYRSIVFSLIVIFFYIVVRFRKWQFGLGAIIALFHDTLVVLSAYAIATALGMTLEVDQVFIAAMLTIIGYSINDTVIVFDRIREFLKLGTKTDREEIFNKAINSTLNRTMITSATTLIVVLVLFIFGGEVLRGFSFSLLIGVLVGTYSSVFIASPVVVDLDTKKPVGSTGTPATATA
ncbi:MAG: protein translocase subunit SecDF [Bacteroidota bacterium]